MPAPISVEDVTAYFDLVKNEVGITHEDELVQALIALTEKIHPLALGNVQRFNNQSRLMARKLLKLHMQEPGQEHEIEQLIDNLKSNLFYHGHPINRKEAMNDLKLKVVIPSADVEDLMWQLYLQYEDDLKITEPFFPLRELEIKAPQAEPNPAEKEAKLDPITIFGAYIESAARSDVFKTDLSVKRSAVNTPFGSQEVIKQELIWQRWEKEK
jgi:hypothetical protein